MSKRSARNVEKLKKKRVRKPDLPAQTRTKGNTAGVRTRLKKAAGITRARRAKAAT